MIGSLIQLTQRRRGNTYQRTGAFRKLFVELRKDETPVVPAQPLAWRKAFWLGFLGLVVISGFWLASMEVNVLVLGTDDVDFSQHTDTIMLVHWKPLPKRLALLSIPRDTLIRLPKRGPLKINAVYAYGMVLGNHAYALAMTRSAIENVLNLRTHFLVHVRYTDFIKLVDDIGGVPITIVAPMDYVDLAGGLNIHLTPGYQLLDGRQALDYVRFRHDRDGDMGRIRRQQEFVRAFITQLANFSKAQKTFRAFQTFLHSMETNIRPIDAIFFALEMRSMAGLRWRTAILPGHPAFVEGKAYWDPDPAGIRTLVATLGEPLRPEVTPVANPSALSPQPRATGVAHGQATPVVTPAAAASRPGTNPRPTPRPAVKPTVKPTLRSAVAASGQPVIRVLNGCGDSGACQAVAQALRQHQLTVLETNITNAPSSRINTSIIKTNAKNLPWARRLATILGLEKRIQLVPPTSTYPTVTVVVGKDHAALLH